MRAVGRLTLASAFLRPKRGRESVTVRWSLNPRATSIVTSALTGPFVIAFTVPVK
jgi:hypothetical protein